MTRVVLTRLFCLTLIFSATNSFAQHNQSLLTQNNILVKLCVENIERIESAYLTSAVDSCFRDATIEQLKTIYQKALIRGAFLLEAHSIKNTNGAKLFKPRQIKLIDLRMIAEWENYYAEIAYCQACNKISDLIPSFTNIKKVYYAEGKYLIPSRYYPQAKEVYKPMVDSIFSVVKMFPKTKFDVTIKTIGYADDAQTAVGTTAYNDMVQRLQSDSLTNAEINNYTSYLRAYDVSDILKKMIQERKNSKSPYLTFNYEPLGNGTTLPDNNQQYEPIDEKRRMVEINWYILPKF